LRTFILIAAAGAIAFILKTALAVNTYGSTDIMTWERDLTKVETQGVEALYRDGVPYISRQGVVYNIQPFIHPPFMVHVLRGWGLLAKMSGLPMRFWLRFTCALADLASVLLVLRIVGNHPQPPPQVVPVLLLAVCPVSLLVSGFHGNTDPIMISSLLLSIYLAESGKPVWLVGAAMGLAVSIKLVALIFAPAILLYLTGLYSKLRYILGTAIMFAAASSPYLFQHRALILAKTLSYTSQFGIWGLSRLFLTLANDARYAWLIRGYAAYGKFALLFAVIAAAIWMNAGRKKPPLMFQCGFTAFLFILLTPGFGVQYLVWLVPWTVLLPMRHLVACHTTSALFLFVYYNRSAHGLPWYFANSLETQVWYGLVVYLALICWFTLLIVTLAFMRQVRHRRAG